MAGQDHWYYFCGHGENFTAWTNNDFGHCFEQVIFLCPSHALLAIMSTYFAAQRLSVIWGTHLHVSWTWFLVLRFTVSLGLALLPLVQILVSDLVLHVTPSIADFVVYGITLTSWMLHGVYVWNVRFLHTVSLRGPLGMFLTVLLVAATQAVHTRSVIMQHLENSVARSAAEEYSTYVAVGLIVVYLLTLVPNSRREYRTDLLQRNINYDALESETESEHLVREHIRSYGTIPHADRQGRTLVAEQGVNCFSWLSFHWVQQLMYRGSQGKIEAIDDTFELPSRLSTERIEKRFHRILNDKPREVNSTSSSTPNGNTSELPNPEVRYRQPRGEQAAKPKTLFHALHSAFGWEYYSLGVLKLLADVFGFTGPILLNLLVTYIEKRTEPEFHGYLYASGLLVGTFLGTICSTQFDYNSQVVGFKLRCVIITTVYRKALTVSSVAQAKFNTGEIVNFMSTDTDRIVNFCPSFHSFWSLPFQVAVSLYLLYEQVGVSFLAGLGFAIILIPINRQLAIKIGQLSTRMMEQKDSRVKLMNEMLCGIRVLKFYAWEDHFTERINELRSKELHSLKGRKYLDAMCVYFWATTPVLISILTFTTYVLLGNKLTAAKVFTSLSLFLMLIAPLNAFPWVINGLMEAWVSLKRVQNFCSLKEVDHYHYYSPLSGAGEGTVVHVQNGQFSWHEMPQCPQSAASVPVGESLSHQTSRPHGSLELSGIDVEIKQGQLVGVIGRVGCGKTSLLNALLAEMGRVRGSVSVQGLEEGFALAAQESWIQNATLCDNILFHQPYDSTRYEAVVWACALTDDLKILPAGDQTEVGENGVTLSGGQKARLALARAVYQNKAIYLLDDPLAAVDAHVAQHLMQHCIMGLLRNKTRILCTHNVRFLAQADVVLFMEDGRIVEAGPPSQVLPAVRIDRDVNAEDESSPVSFTARTAGFAADASLKKHKRLVAVLLEAEDNVSFYLTVYGVLAGANSVFTFMRAFLFAYGGICAARVLHRQLLASVLKAPVSFFDTTPIGRIINRFSSDLYAIDDSLPFQLNIFLAQIFGILGVLVITCYGLPWFMLCLIPLGFVYYRVQHYYRHTSRELKRLSSISLSPLYAHFSESIMGLATIRAFRQTDIFRQENMDRLTANQRAQYSTQAAARWLDLRLRMLGVVIVGSIAFIAVIQHHFQGVDPGLVGLAITYSLSVTNLLGGVVMFFTETEKQLVSVERAHHYITSIPSEKWDGTLFPPSLWPKEGVVRYDRVHMRYRPGLPDALNGISFETQPGEKLGIVGRTGSGKSSLFLTLFRMVEIYDGEISVDGMNLKLLDLKDIRSHFAIIPQDPFLFSGSVRFNLDPTGCHCDDDLWAVLARCHLGEVVEMMGGLETDVGERGRHFSLGQRQLVCLARALLTKAKVLCIDEATASVDHETDSQVQMTIRSEFASSTVLTIAHRINTVMDSHRVLVMADGNVAELAPPAELLQNPQSQFYRLAHSSL
ncbi:hypothetical protein BaRGS_00003339 [Batillaria attramentaria]|uniref:ABC-type xenobiotic transporter n=1 Tax=Batillaria attramentaria TaxID=370345 RepID=A0ABD0M0Z7_9CAEN